MRRIIIGISGAAVLAALGGGLASALLSMLTAQKTSLALAMGCVAPLPIMLAALSFGSIPGFVAAIIGSLAVGLFDIRQNGLALVSLEQWSSAGTDMLVYAIGLALPAWWLARVTASTRFSAPTIPAADARKLGLVLVSACVFSIVSVGIDFVGTIATHGGFQATMAMMAERVEPYVQGLFVNGRELPKGIDVHDLAVVLTWAQMPVLTAASFVLLGFNIWIAARITRASGRFPAPWPDLPRSLRAPRWLAAALFVALGLAFVGGLPGLLALSVAGALGMAFAVQGLALVHDVTRGKSYRLPLLIIVYLTLGMLMPWLLIVYALVGLADAALGLRERRRKPPGNGAPSIDRSIRRS
jgi:hypothetical protein